MVVHGLRSHMELVEGDGSTGQYKSDTGQAYCTSTWLMTGLLIRGELRW